MAHPSSLSADNQPGWPADFLFDRIIGTLLSFSHFLSV